MAKTFKTCENATNPLVSSGMIEQVIMAGARLFIATPHSTFSGYVPRLRGYLGAPDLNIYYNTHFYWGPLETKAAQVPVDGQDFYREFSALWKP